MDSHNYVIDTDCLVLFLNCAIGKTILRKIKIIIPPSIYYELNLRLQKQLENYNLQIEELDDNDVDYAAKLIHQINIKKQYKNRYLSNRNTRIKNKGECEGAAIAVKFNIDIILKDGRAITIIKKRFQHRQNRCMNYIDFGIMILETFGSNDNIEEFKEELRKQHVYI